MNDDIKVVNDGHVLDAEGGERKVDMTNDIEELIELSLSGARSAIEEDGSWEPLVHILHPKGVESVVIRGMGADPRQKDQLASRINSRLKKAQRPPGDHGHRLLGQQKNSGEINDPFAADPISSSG